MGKGSNTTSTSSTSYSTPDAQAGQAYRDILRRAQDVASTPYQAYSGQLSAGQNSQQNLGVAGTNANANFANPYITRAAELAGASVTPVNGTDIMQYYDPYQQKVIDATSAQFQHSNAQQQAQLQGNQIAQGALGGNATGVAKAILASNQSRDQNAQIAGLESAGFSQALQAAQAQKNRGLTGANSIAQYGIGGQQAALQAAGQQFGMGTQQQATDQAALERLYQQYAQQQAFPYQQTQWLGGLATGVGSQLGGTTSSNGTTTGPAPNSTAQWIGAGLTAASLLSDRRAKTNIEKIGQTNDGQNLYRYQYKGSDQWHIGPMAQEVDPEHRGVGGDGLMYIDLKGATDDAVERAAGGGVMGYASGGGPTMPWAGVGGLAAGWIPQIGIHAGSGAPQARGSSPSAPSQGGGFDPGKMAQGIAGAAKGVGGLDWRGAWDAGLGNLSGDSWGGGSFWKGDSYGGDAANPLPGLVGGTGPDSDYEFADGGAVMGDYDPPGGAAGQQTTQSSPIQMRPNGNGTVSVINVRTGQVLHTGSPSSAASAHASWSARTRAYGGGVRGFAGGGVPFYDDPTMPVGEFGEDADQAPADFGNRFSAVGDGGRSREMPRGMAMAHYLRGPDGVQQTNDFQTASVNPDDPVRLHGSTFGPEGPPAPVQAADDEGDDGATAVTGRTSVAGKPPVMAFEGSSHYKSIPDAVPQAQQNRGFGLGLLPGNVSTGLLAAGLGMMASRSPNLGNAIGEGGLAGLGAYSRAEAADREALSEAQKLSREARQQAYQNWSNERKQSETERHNMAIEKKEAAARLPAGMTLDSKGRMVNTPGYLEALKERATAKAKEPISPEQAKFIAEQYVLGGDKSVMVGMTRTPENLIAIRKAIQDVATENGLSAQEVALKTAEFQGLVQAQRKLGTQEAGMLSAAVEAKGAIKLARGAIERVPRTGFLPFNQLIQGYQRKTLNEDQLELMTRIQGIVNTYASVLARGANITTDASRHKADELLNGAYNSAGFNRVLDTLESEIDMAIKSPEQVREIYRKHYGGKGVHGGSVTDSVAGSSRAGAPGAAGGAGGFVPPPGALSQTHNGKIYYYDPNTKQPYPGQ